jgi:hypothetical protein
MGVRGHLNLCKKRQELEQSGHHIDILSRPEVLHCLVYLSVSKSHDNSYCGWCCSIDCAQSTMWVGGSLAELAHRLNQHGTVVHHPVPHTTERRNAAPHQHSLTHLSPPTTPLSDQLWTRQLKIWKRVKEEKSLHTEKQSGSLELLSLVLGEDTKGNVARMQELHMHSNYSFHNRRRYFLSTL